MKELERLEKEYADNYSTMTPAERQGIIDKIQQLMRKVKAEETTELERKRALGRERAARHRAKVKAEEIARNERLVKLEIRDARKRQREEEAQRELMKEMTPQQRWRYKNKVKKLIEEQLIAEQEQIRLREIIERANNAEKVCPNSCQRCSHFVDLFMATKKGQEHSFCMRTLEKVSLTDSKCRWFKCSKKKASRVKTPYCMGCDYRLENN